MNNNDDIWLKEVITQIDKKIDKVDERLNSMNKTLIKQELNISEHMLRTEIAEENIALLREQIKPISSHVNTFHTVLKLIGIVSVIATIIEAIIQVIDFVS